MRLRSVLAVLVIATLAGAAGLIASVGVSNPGFLAGTPVGRWLGVRKATAALPIGTTPALEGQSIGPLALTDLDGHPQSLPAGRRILVNVWASWCVPCRDEMPLLTQFAKSQGSDGVLVIGLAEDDVPAVRAYLRQTSVNYPILLDDAQWRAGVRLGNRLGVLPYTALIDSEGHLLRRQSGPFASLDALRHWAGSTNPD